MSVALMIAAVVAALGFGTMATDDTGLGGPGKTAASTAQSSPGIAPPTLGVDDTGIGGPG